MEQILGLQGPWWYSGEPVARVAGNMVLFGFFLPLAPLSHWRLSVEVTQLLGSWRPCQCWIFRGATVIVTGDMVLLGVFSSLWQLCLCEN